MVALLMVVIIGMAGFAIDGSNIYSQHRKLQADLDVAVKVAASAMWDFQPSDASYTDTMKAAIVAAAQILADDGYANTLTYTTSASIQPIGGSYQNGFCGSSTVGHTSLVLCNPPQSGPFQGSPHFDYVEGTLSGDVGGYFGGAIGLGSLHVSVRAVAWHGGYHEPYALIGLDPISNACSISGGGGTLTVDGSLVGDAVTCGGTNPDVTGHSDEVGSGNSGQIVGQSGTNQNVPMVTDPFTPTGDITPTEPVTTVPDVEAVIPPQCYNEVMHYIPSITLSMLTANSLPADTHFYFPPTDGAAGIVPLSGPVGGNAGTNEFLPLCDGTDTGQPGVYYFTGGILTPGKVYINSFNSIFIFDSSSSELFHDTGQAVWALSAPTSGPYAGIALSQTRTGTEPPCPAGSSNYSNTNSIDFTGTGKNGGFSAVGAVDVPCTDVYAAGDSNVTISGELVAWDVQTNGHTNVSITYDPASAPADKGSVLVE